jgi:hypothetical protein
VIEQVAGWAGWADANRFADRALRASWVYFRLRADLLEGVDAARWSTSSPESRAVFDQVWAEAERSATSGMVSMPVLVEHLEELRDATPENSEPRALLDNACANISSKACTRAWIDATNARFKRELDRWRRTRNALVHGGPVGEATVELSVRFAENLARDALAPTIHALLHDESVCDAFLRREDQFRLCIERLQAGVPASEAMFWDPEET